MFSKNKIKTGYIAIKLDMKKAYDKLDWNFIRKCSQDLGFTDKWANWTMQCITTTTFKVMVNGKIGAPFIPERGIR